MTNPAVPFSSTVVDSILFRDAFGTAKMRALFSDHALIQRYIDVEVALAKAEARIGVIPADAADVIARESRIERIDFDHMREETDIVGYPILPLVHQLVGMCGDAGRYVHWGATTQDIMDTAVALQVRDALDSIDGDIRELRGILADLAKRHRDTAMAGRTHLQQALPVTFGYKAAIWLAMFDRHQQRLAQLRGRVAVVEFAGAAGTLASIGDKGFAVQQALADELGLGVPATTWHVARDGFAEAVNLLALVTGSLGKIALDIMIMASTEFAEVYEPFVKGRGASSTMPQKRNPISSELMLAAAKAVRQHAGLMVDAMVQDFERATGPWHAEWIAIPESFILTAGALHQAKFALGGLIVDAARMKHNLGISKGLIVAEAVMMQMAPFTGRQQAHDIVYDACRTVNEQGGTLADALAALPAVTQHFDRAAIDRMTDPANYLGLAPQMVDRAIALSGAI
ncbi:class-II fumarase/aspartase family protein [Paraburkholderia caballeronis]|uniref:3-carboxy-cis,cis-muconate cycloisomerase n=1 Tax=Paraburkholderia caballeronis TaxID=416943 RepID=A0A1H7QAB4_9BURK|nr:adenylosuccinate lyase family protein [Paraburkholderia caballeronis]PXW16373.1 3-carboxy-cis,cis-muconate cycloisomerase [Paraburkholderia caballeronis]PXW94050.1 3-carboxy-cis,cis-muconate cycloisomerase [Paraburkholderia caballeronis]RAJ89114.1 3-carboxy-cis,cis-muconate cycloisomerase [Paraburkholderia caballeronis]TDV14902.1 3-carboxy-cis,cis-muconate cycloisomerase [Paraburkholderia caballeronis]TDV16974.1 3-carboxy-cis,cis-muconate cycloisomerase [Paraburkholderia caballeronis]